MHHKFYVVSCFLCLQYLSNTVIQGLRTPLHIAAYNGCSSAVEMLVKHNANVMARDVVSLY